MKTKTATSRTPLSRTTVTTTTATTNGDPGGASNTHADSSAAESKRSASGGITMGNGAQAVTLFSDRPLFEQQWSQALTASGLEPTAARPHQLAEALGADRASVKGATLVIDAGSDGYDEDELLAHVGLARALGAVPVVSVPTDVDISSIDDILDDLCSGLVTRRPEDVSRVIAALARRADASRARRFEYLTVSPRGGELLAIFSDGSAVLVDRELLEEDDGSAIEAIALVDEAMAATVTLESGRELRLSTSVIAQKGLLGGRGTNGGGATEVDGVRLGARIRELRLAAGLTQAELARRTGIHRPNIARVEAGRHTPSLETLSRLANAIGVPTTRVLDDC